MSIDACAALVQKGDPERFRAAMCAPMPARARLMVFYAFNLELARAPYASTEPMIAEMRVQWWADAVAEIYEGKPPRAHEVVTPLADLLTETSLPREPIDLLIEARRGDARREDPARLPALDAYLANTGGGLMMLAARMLGCAHDKLEAARDFGWGTAAAFYLSAVPDLVAHGRRPLPEPQAETIAHLAVTARTRLASARRHRSGILRAAHPAFLAGANADAILKSAANPETVLTGALIPSEFQSRTTLAYRALTGRW